MPILAFPPAHWGSADTAALFAMTRSATGWKRSLTSRRGCHGPDGLGARHGGGIAIARSAFRGRACSAFFTAPLLLPTSCWDLALLLVFAQLGLLATCTGLVIGHAWSQFPM